MDIQLTAIEARVLGCLMEKERTTPDQYPMSLNGITTACNQKSNRDPVMNLDESQVQEGIDGLMKKMLVSDKGSMGSRVVKYKQRLCGTEFSELKLSQREAGVLCMLLLRGPQTPGELRSRTNRLCEFDDVAQVESVLQGLMQRDDGPFVQCLAREPGRRESRYVQLLCADDALPAAETAHPDEFGTAGFSQAQLQELVDIVSDLKQEVQALKSEVARLSGQSEQS